MKKWLEKLLGFISKSSSTNAASTQINSPFLLGLDDAIDLETLSTENFLQLIQWNEGSPTNIEAKTLENLLGNLPE